MVMRQVSVSARDSDDTLTNSQHRGFFFGSCSGELAPATIRTTSTCVCAVFTANGSTPQPLLDMFHKVVI